MLPGTAIVSVTSDSLSQVSGFVAVKKGSTAFIPAIVYVQIKQTKICELNSRIATKIFDSVCQQCAATGAFSKKLAGRHLEIQITSIPRKFLFRQQSDIYMLLFMQNSQFILPDQNGLSINYQLSDAGKITKKGTIRLQNTDRPYGNPWKSTRKVTKIYLGQYKENMKILAFQCMRQLANELN